MKKILFATLTFVSIAFFSCKKETELKIGVSLGPSQERWTKDFAYFQTTVSSLGGKVIMKEAKGDEMLQLQQIEELLCEKIKVLVIVPENSNSLCEVVKKANKKGIKVIAYDRIINNCNIDFYASFDNIKVGEMQVDFITRVKPVGNYAIIRGDEKDNNSMLLTLGQMNILQPLIEKGDIKIVLNKAASSWSSDEAYKYIDEYLTINGGEGLDAVIASNDNLAKGVVAALEKHGVAKKVLISGQDAELEAVQRIVAGSQTMTVYKFIYSLGNNTAKLAVSLAKGEPLPATQLTVNNGFKMVPAMLLPSMIPVHKDNIRMTVIADDYLSEQDIFKK